MQIVNHTPRALLLITAGQPMTFMGGNRISPSVMVGRQTILDGNNTVVLSNWLDVQPLCSS